MHMSKAKSKSFALNIQNHNEHNNGKVKSKSRFTTTIQALINHFIFIQLGFILQEFFSYNFSHFYCLLFSPFQSTFIPLNIYPIIHYSSFFNLILPEDGMWPLKQWEIMSGHIRISSQIQRECRRRRSLTCRMQLYVLTACLAFGSDVMTSSRLCSDLV